ncbi:MAG TPA: DNA polymerase IV [Actinomycetota bacterium]|jgi:DNA polymerase IV|nr:DNA polymerase IV [Actinomycetota bacterium]
MRRWIFHLDLDEFIAAVERLRRPELAGKPIVVGGDGDPSKRGVVSTASYEARVFGIRSAMPLRTAYKRNPEAIFLAVDADAYLAASREVMDTLRTFEARVEVAGWDEAFLSVETDEPEDLAREMQDRVLERTRLWSTIGIGDNRLQAKLASGFGKPRGVFTVTSERWPELMFGLPTTDLWGVGSKTAGKLAELGIRTVGDLATADEDALAERFGPNTGPWLASLGRGEGSSRVHPEGWTAKGHGRERTFQRDLTDHDEIRRETVRLADAVLDDLRREERSATHVTVKVRFAPFFTSTHGVTLGEPTMEPEALRSAALRALGRFELDRPVRLLGVRAEMAPPQRPRGAQDARSERER